jgi:hypothetical protein
MIQEATQASSCEFQGGYILVGIGAAIQNVIGRIATASCICKDCDGPDKLMRPIVVGFQMHAAVLVDATRHGFDLISQMIIGPALGLSVLIQVQGEMGDPD